MANIFVCRHGQDLDNVDGLLNGHRNRPLSTLGEQQAAQVAENIASGSVKFVAIYASPLARAKMTADAIGAAISIPVVVRDDLIERDFGVLTGRPYSDITKMTPPEDLLQGDQVLYFTKSEGGESFAECLVRAKKVLQDVDAKHPGENVLLVCHGDIGKMLQAARGGMSWEDGLRQPYFANTAVLPL